MVRPVLVASWLLAACGPPPDIVLTVEDPGESAASAQALRIGADPEKLERLSLDGKRFPLTVTLTGNAHTQPRVWVEALDSASDVLARGSVVVTFSKGHGHPVTIRLGEPCEVASDCGGGLCDGTSICEQRVCLFEPAGPADHLVLVQGDAQSSTVASPVPLEPLAQVVDAQGTPVSGYALGLSPSGDGLVGAASVLPDDSCIVHLGTWTLATTAGANQLTVVGLPPLPAQAGAAELALAATGVPAAADHFVLLEGDEQTAVAGMALPIDPRVQVVDAFANPIADYAVELTPSGAGSVDDGAVITDADGIATPGRWFLDPVLPGANTLLIEGNPALAGGTGPASLSLSATGIAAISVEPVYSSLPIWNGYVKNDNPSADIFHQAGTPCTGAESTISDCLHSGELRKVVIGQIASCGGLAIRDALAAFDWTCREDVASVSFYSLHLREDKVLSDLIDADDWKPNRVIVSLDGTDIAESAPLIWWLNPVTQAPDNASGSLVQLDAYSAIYTVPTSRATAGYQISANAVGLVVLPGATLSYNGSNVVNCNTDRCMVYSADSQFLWVEGTLDGLGNPASAAIGLFGYHVDASHVRNLTVSDCGIGLLLDGDRNHVHRANVFSNFIGMQLNGSGDRVRMVRATDNEYGVFLNGCGENTLSELVITNGGSAAITTGVGCTGDVLTRTVAARDYFATFADTWSRETLAFLTIDDSDLDINHGDNHTYVNLAVLDSTIQAGATTGNLLSHIALLDSAVELNPARFTGPLMVTDPTTTCVDVGAGSPPLQPATCANRGASDADLILGVSGLEAFVGKVSDATNPSDVNGQQTYDAVSDWLHFDSPYRGWVGADGACSSGEPCEIRDWRVTQSSPLWNRSGTGAVQNQPFVPGAPCPSAVSGDQVITDQHTVPNRFLTNAMEILDDYVGDEDGLCETNERCIYAPNFGAYQGEGDYESRGPCVFQDGGVTGVKGVTMYAYPISGL